MSSRFEDVEFLIEGSIGIITMATCYWTGTWAEMLDVVRSGRAKGLKCMVVDYSRVRELGDGSLEAVILKREFVNIGGLELVHVAVPEFIKQLWSLFDEDLELKSELESIREFVSVAAAKQYLRDKFES